MSPPLPTRHISTLWIWNTMTLSSNVPILTQSFMETTSLRVRGAFENPMRTTVDGTRDCVHEGSSSGPDEEARRLSTGSWHSSDCLSLLTVLMPPKRQSRQQKTRQWESQPSQWNSKWNEGAVSQNKPVLPYVAFGGFIWSQQRGWS